jgi:hypothetical protein
VPVDIVAYENEEDLFIANAPTVRKITVGKKGEMTMAFSGDMVFPDEWNEKAASDTETLQLEAQG